MALVLKSPAFENGREIPVKYTCQGEDLSPPLEWSGEVSGVKEWAITCEDPDAPMGTWIHWVLYGIPAEVHRLEEGVPKRAVIPQGRHGKNSWGRADWGGPCPPSGRHRYFFTLYALKEPLGLPAGASWEEFQKALKGRILEKAQWMGTYQKK